MTDYKPQGEVKQIVTGGRGSVIHLSNRDRDVFLAACESDDEPNENLRRAAADYAKTMPVHYEGMPTDAEITKAVNER